MNHPRRLLFFVPLALLVTALLLRSRLPRPQTEGDKWLWATAESAPMIEVGLGYSGVLDKGLKSNLPDTFRGVCIKDREGIRNVLRAFRRTPSFMPTSKHAAGAAYFPGLRSESLAWFAIGDDSASPDLYLLGEKGRYYLYNGAGEAMTDDASVKRFCQVMREAIVKTRQFQEGYTF